LQLLILNLFNRLQYTDGEIESFDKSITEQLYFSLHDREDYQILEALTGMGSWCIASILLESGNVERFKAMGKYLSYAGIACGKEQSAETDVKKKPNPFSNHLLKFAYRTVAFTILNTLKRTKKKQEVSDLATEDLLYAYAIRIQARHDLKPYQQANKMAAKVARIVYALLKSKQPYDPHYNPLQLQKDKQEIIQNQQMMKRVNYLRDQVALFHHEFKEIFERTGLIHLPMADDVLSGFENVSKAIQNEPFLSELEIRVRQLRHIQYLQKIEEKNSS